MRFLDKLQEHLPSIAWMLARATVLTVLLTVRLAYGYNTWDAAKDPISAAILFLACGGFDTVKAVVVAKMTPPPTSGP